MNLFWKFRNKYFVRRDLNLHQFIVVWQAGHNCYISESKFKKGFNFNLFYQPTKRRDTFSYGRLIIHIGTKKKKEVRTGVNPIDNFIHVTIENVIFFLLCFELYLIAWIDLVIFKNIKLTNLLLDNVQ